MITIISTFRFIAERYWTSQKLISVRRFIFVIVFSFILPIQLCQAQIYVDPCAPVEGDGSQTNPFKTLVSAVAKAKITTGNDNIIMKGGEYFETLTIDEAVTLTAQGGSAFVGRAGGLGWRNMNINVGNGLTTNARAYYPSNGNGENAAISCGTAFPVIVYVHGKRNPNQSVLCSWSDNELRTDNTRDYLQAEGILKRLASNGAIVVSFNWHTLTIHENEIGSYVLELLNYMGNVFGSNIDLNNVGLIGHSTGGAAVMYTAQSLNKNGNPSKGIALIAPAFPLHPNLLGMLNETDLINLYGPVLVVHGTNEHSCQVGTSPLKIYCQSTTPKHLVVITGANHFGYTDGICLDPDQPREGECIYFNPWESLPDADGFDNPSEVGGLTGQQAQSLQQYTVGSYLEAFFSNYLHGNTNSLEYLNQQKGNNCGGSDQGELCSTFKSDVYMWWPNSSSRNLCSQTEIFIGDGFSNNSVVINYQTNGDQWNYLGQFEFKIGAYVEIQSFGGCSVIADAVKFVLPDKAEEFIIDNNSQDGALIKQGTWNVSLGGSGWYGEDYLMSTDLNAKFRFHIMFPTIFNNAGCEPIRYFDDLQSLGVEVSVCSCTR